MASPERNASSKAIVSTGNELDDADDVSDAQRTQTMMYAARMKYLDDTDQIQPDSLFMTRKQAQKVAQRHDTTVALKKLDGVGSPTRKTNAVSGATAAASPASLAAWKRANHHRMSIDERQQVWEAKFQAGCHFWQNVETSECRATPPPNAQHVHNSHTSHDGHDDDEDNDDTPFPDSFAFLNTASNSSSSDK